MPVVFSCGGSLRTPLDHYGTDLACSQALSFRPFLDARRRDTDVVVVGCSRCGNFDERRLYALLDGQSLCSTCWKAALRPWPRHRANVGELHAAESATRDRMLARGGAHRHQVRKGLT
jgi:hypothetical protein